MKKLLALTIAVILGAGLSAQVPEKMSYQAVVRNTAGELVKNSPVGMKISILQGSESGTAVYVETHTKTTNENGLITLEIGGGTIVTGTFAGVDWPAGTYFLKTETDPSGGTSYTIIGTSQMLSVPYSLYAKYAYTSSDAVKFHNPSLSVIGNNSPIINTGTRNVFIGKSSGMTNTTGTFNLFLGSEAGFKNTIGNNNVAIGHNALRENDEGNSNVAIGLNALEKNRVSAPGSTDPQGNGNIAIGENSLRNATSFYNVAVGAGSLMSLTSGTDNTAIGGSAMSNLLSGRQNTSLGAASMIYSTGEASYNVTIGVSSGERIAGNGNVFIGAHSGNHNKGSGNVFIGYLSGWGTTWENASSRLIIHNGNNNIHDIPLIYGEFDNSKVVINGSLRATDGLDVNNKLITNVSNPVNTSDAANKAYVDALLQKINQLESQLEVGVVKDVEGNLYTTIKIGTQSWMVENLKTIKYNDGTGIPLKTLNTDWANLTTPAYCWYDNDAATYKTAYGALYNWYAVNTGKLCPTGWHVPTDADWSALQDYLIANGYNYDGSLADNKIGKSLATANLVWWYSSNPGTVGNTDYTDKRNATGFTGYPGGERGTDGSFIAIQQYGMWWSYTEFDAAKALGRALYSDSYSLIKTELSKKIGNSIRCIKD